MKTLALLLSLFLAAPALSAERPNFVVIFIDDLNTDVGYEGAPVETPNIDRLAARGRVFRDAHCNAPVCNPSRTSLLLGKLPPDTGVQDNDTHFRELPGGRDAVTLPQHLKENGYATVGAGKIFHNGWRPKSHPGHKFHDREASWSEYHENDIGTDNAPKPDRPWHRGQVKTWWGNSFVWGEIDQATEETDDFQNAAWIGDRLNKGGDEPMFLAAGIYRPHLPFYAPSAYFDRHAINGQPQLEGYLEDDVADLPATGKKWANKTGVGGPIVRLGHWGDAVQAYRASTSFADACVGRVLDAVDASPLKDNTYVVLLSDHGFQLGEKGAWTKFSFWNRVSRVPFIIAGPGIEPGETRATVSLVDLYPTLVSLAGLPPREGLAGRDLTPLLEDPDAVWNGIARIFHEPAANEAVIDADFRYIRYADGGEELYDRRTDPHDFHNLAGDPAHASTLAAYREKLYLPN